ncbi:protein CREG1-like [Ctenocephalides felis]|uniref:protein CREG1-like n=1 Tax=Ctenocephalides felis TaxID=7515 RepID=UPI000E6E58A9|nr:protein CREG1-like [Ctenocephalides felis]
MRKLYVIIFFITLFLCIITYTHGNNRNVKKKAPKLLRAKHSNRDGSKDPVVNRRLAGIARQILRQSTWGDLATISSITNSTTNGYPFVTPKIFAEGNSSVSTGKPYFYLDSDYFQSTDVVKDSRVSFTVNTEQTGACSKRGYIVQNPKCFWVVYSGDFVKLKKGSKEYDQGYSYLMEKYPEIKDIPDKENYYVGTVKLVEVMVVAGKKMLECIPLPAYFEASPNEDFESEMD